MTIVSVYNETGWLRDLAPLNQGRRQHACGSYVNGGKKVNQVNQIVLFQTYIIFIFLVFYGDWGI